MKVLLSAYSCEPCKGSEPGPDFPTNCELNEQDTFGRSLEISRFAEVVTRIPTAFWPMPTIAAGNRSGGVSTFNKLDSIQRRTSYRHMICRPSG
jgi:hypothetical protein